jgi:hypothetical protein
MYRMWPPNRSEMQNVEIQSDALIKYGQSCMVNREVAVNLL